jgi:hypothetical protein
MPADQPRPKLPTADQAEQMFHAAIKAGDTEGVHAALVALAVRDPHRAQDLLDMTKIALKVASDPKLRPMLMAMLRPAGRAATPEPVELVERVKAGTIPAADVAVALAHGLLEIAEVAMPSAYFATDSRCQLARAWLTAEGEDLP